MRSPIPDGTTCSRPSTDGFLPCAQVATAGFSRQAIFLAATGSAGSGTRARGAVVAGCMACCARDCWGWDGSGWEAGVGTIACPPPVAAASAAPAGCEWDDVAEPPSDRIEPPPGATTHAPTGAGQL